MVAAVADIRNLQPRVRCELALDAEVERLAISQLEGSGIDSNLWEYSRRGIAARGYLVDDTGVIGRAVGIIPIEATCSVRSQLWSETIWDTLEKRDAHGVVDDPEGSVNHGLRLQLISQPDRGSELPRVLVPLKAVASAVS
jgi:hypothetical protein